MGVQRWLLIKQFTQAFEKGALNLAGETYTVVFQMENKDQ